MKNIEQNVQKSQSKDKKDVLNSVNIVIMLAMTELVKT